MIPALALLATLSWTTPVLDTAGHALPPVPLECIVIAQRQSPLWAATAPHLNPASDQRVWRYVPAEADTSIVWRGSALPGSPCSIALADTSRDLMYAVVTRQVHSPWSQRSNTAVRP